MTGQPLAVGSTIGPYEILARIGAGGMGEVFRARDPKLDRDVALKVLPAQFADDLNRRARFEREARLLAALNHPNIGAIHGYVETGSVSALVLELIDGMTLEHRLAGGAIPATEAIAIARQIASAMDAAHERGIIHRDLKPANIKIASDGVVKVLDFGIAKAIASTEIEAAESAPTRPLDPTQEGSVIGTAAYMSPEQARGLSVDKRTDIWAFGCVLFEMLTGKRAYSGATSSDTIAAILNAEPQWSLIPAGTPEPLVALLRRCLEKDVRRRLRDIGDAFAVVDAAPSATPAIGSPSRWTWLASAIALVAVIALIVVLARASTAPPASAGVPPAKIEQITIDSGLTATPALSPDGKLLAYASDRAGRGDLDIWLAQTKGGAPIRLTDDPSDDVSPSFSPDGSQIAFRSERSGGGLYVISTLGGAARRIASIGYAPRFSPDGTKIAYWTGPWRGNAVLNGTGQSFVLPLAGGDPSRLVPSFPTAREPVWSPDGKSVALIGRDPNEPGNESDIWWVPFDGRAPVRTGALDFGDLRESISAVSISSAVLGNWTKRGLLVTANNGLWMVPIAPESGHLSGPVTQLTLGAGRYIWPNADANGTIVFAGTEAPRVVERAPLDNEGAATLIYTDGQSGASRPSQSRDGSRILYDRRGPGYTELWLKSAREADRFVIRVAPGAFNPVISSDGLKAAYTLADVGVGMAINLDSGVPSEVCKKCSLWGFLSDNQRILAIDEAATRLSAIDTRNGTSQDLLRASGRIGRTHLSPDDKWLTFSKDGKIFITAVSPGTPAPESGWHQIDQPTETGRACGWSMDSTTAYLLLDTDGFRCLWGQRIDPRTGVLVGKPFAVRHFHKTVTQEFSTSLGNAISEKGFIYGGGLLKANLWRLTPQ
jgi:dipeptidyl aminopeptidase/acylaminoacyl peptidase